MVELAICPIWADTLKVVKKDAVVSFWSLSWRSAGLTTGCKLKGNGAVAAEEVG